MAACVSTVTGGSEGAGDREGDSWRCIYHSNHQIIVTRVMHEDSRISWHGLILYSAVWWCVRLWLTGKPHSHVGLGMRLYTAHCGSEIASFPGSHTSEYKHGSCPGVESLLSFLTWPWHNRNRTRVLEQKGNVLRVVQPTMHSMFGVYDICPPIAG